MASLLSLGLLEALLVAGLVVRRRERRHYSPWLVGWLALAFAHQLTILVSHQAPDWNGLALLGFAPLLHGPIAYGYAADLLGRKGEERQARRHALAALAAVLAVGGATAFTSLELDLCFGVAVLRDGAGGQVGATGWIMLASGLLYPLAALRLALTAPETPRRAARIRWLRIWLGVHLAGVALIVAAQFSLPLPAAMLAASLVMAFQVLITGFLAFSARGRPPEAEAVVMDADVDRLAAHLSDHRPFREPGLSAPALAQACGLSEATLSAAIRKLGHAHFFDLANAVRVRDVAERLSDPTETRDILTLAFEAGFNSKTAFNRAFRARYAMTPSAYRRLGRTDRRQFS